MTSVWDDVRSAIATKLNNSTGCATAGLRRALADVDEPLTMVPEARVLQPSYTMLSQSGSSEEYLLDIPFELVLSRAGRRSRSNATAAQIARAIQVEFQTGVKLGVSISLVTIVDARLLSMEPGLSVYDDQDAEGNPTFDGYRGVVQVQVFESVTRTV